MSKNNRWLPQVDRFMLSTHLYTGLFLGPWMVVYAVSGFCINHHAWITDRFGVVPPHWEVVRRSRFEPTGSSASTAEQARAILRMLHLEGLHHIPPRLPRNRLVINRPSGTGNYRITWQRDTGLVVVERQRPFSLFRMVNYFHFRAGYHLPYLAATLWAVAVDAVTVCILFWVVSGVYLWIRRPSKRRLGGACLAIGSAMFIVLVAALSF